MLSLHINDRKLECSIWLQETCGLAGATSSISSSSSSTYPSCLVAITRTRPIYPFHSPLMSTFMHNIRTCYFFSCHAIFVVLLRLTLLSLDSCRLDPFLPNLDQTAMGARCQEVVYHHIQRSLLCRPTHVLYGLYGSRSGVSSTVECMGCGRYSTW